MLELDPGAGPKLQRAVHAVLTRLHRSLSKKNESEWRSVATGVLDAALPKIETTYGDAVGHWLKDWRRSLLQNIHHTAIEDYEVNVLSTVKSSRAPVVFETLPSASNLFGWIGRRAVGDQPPMPHFTEINAGALLEADGGVLALQASDFQGAPGVWSTLKTCLKYGELHIDDAESSSTGRSGLKPQPIRLDVKVVMIGDYALFDHLFETEPDFRDMFKIRVDFDSEVPLTSAVLRREYPAMVSQICERDGLRPLNSAAVARLLEYGVRKAGRKKKITTQSWLIADILREADHYAKCARRRVIGVADVGRAIDEGIERLNLVETKMGEMISEGTILITTSGTRVGQVNGLAIYDMGDYQFAKPSRITAETSVGHGGIINIERESGFSGRSHDKGVHILAGYLRSRFAQKRPLSLTSSVCFEQSYSGVDGDSASATEIYAILSSLSGLPIRQDIAVTGSLNQKGDMQPIGGVNEKIEGFYDCVRMSRPTGREGVIIPRKNVIDLMLRRDVVDAVARGRFHIYSIDTIEQGIEILTGVPAGRMSRRGNYPSNSVFGRVEARLEEIAQRLRRYSDGDE